MAKLRPWPERQVNSRKRAPELKSPANLQQNHGLLQVPRKFPAAG